MLVTDESHDHWMVGKTVRTCDDVGVVKEVREHTVEVDGDRETVTRVVVRIDDELGSYLRNVGSQDVQVMGQ